MNKSDFEYDYDSFRGALAKTSYGYKRARDKFLDNVKYWNELDPNFLQGNVLVQVGADGKSVNGETLGKKFSIALMPLVIEGENYALAVLSTDNLLSGHPVEIDRFLVSVNGTILSAEREELLSSDDDFQGYKLLIAVVRRVLHYSPKE